jgi:hypothetical protein
MSMATDRELLETQAWVERAVIGLNLCPFAKAPQARGRVRYVVTAADDADSLLACLADELKLLQAEPPEGIETTLLIHPHLLTDFDDYNDFLDVAESALVALDLEGVIQIASFHPQYRFEGSEPDDIANATNRSPYPILHLLREDSLERALAGLPGPERIYEANIATMERLGPAGWAALQRQCLADAVQATGASGSSPESPP